MTIKTTCLLAIFMSAAFISNAQNCVGGSINAYYDAIFLTAFQDNPDSCSSAKAFRILSSYSSEKTAPSFTTEKLRNIYGMALGNIFKVDSVFAYFRKSSGSTKITRRLKDTVDKFNRVEDEFKTLKTDQDSLQAWKINEVVGSLFSPVGGEGQAHNIAELLANRKEIKDFNSRFSEGDMERVQSRDSLLWMVTDARQRALESISSQLMEKNKQLSKLKTVITQIVIDNITKPGKPEGLDSALVAMITNTGTVKYQLPNVNLDNQTARFSSGALSDSFYYKNETYSLSNFKIPSQTEMIDALAIYLAKRFKQEVALTLVDQFRKVLKNDGLLIELFPETYKMFSTGKVYEMPSFGSAWNYAVSKDFNKLLPNLGNSTYVNRKIGDSLLVKHLKEMVAMGDLVNRQFSMVDVVSSLHFMPQKSELFNRNINTLYAINKQLFDTASAGRFWVSAEQLFRLSDDEFNLFVALTVEKHRGSEGLFKDYVGADTLHRLRNLLSSELVLLNNFQAQQRRYLQMQNNSFNVQLADYWSFMNQVFDVLNTDAGMFSPRAKKYMSISTSCFEIYGLLNQKNYAGAALQIIDLLPQLKDDNYVDIGTLLLNQKKIKNIDSDRHQIEKVKRLQALCNKMSDTLKLLFAIKKLGREVAAATDYRSVLNDDRVQYFRRKSLNINYDMGNLRKDLTDTIGLEKALIKLGREFEGDKKDEEKRTYMKGNADALVKNLLNHYNSEEVQEYLVNTTADQFDAFRKLTGFLSDMLLAGNSKSLSQVIEKYALPPNSYKIKRASHTSWDLNAYVGGYIGAEMLNTDGKRSPGGVYGFSVPVGVSYSWGKINRSSSYNLMPGRRYASLKGNAVTVTFSLIDIGAVVSYRLGHTSEGLPSQVSWAQILSPGFHIRFGIKDTPLCWSAGIQQTPLLRKIDTAGSSTQVSAVRAYVGIFFDLPLYNIAHQ